jgi:signal transduction histidine kinase
MEGHTALGNAYLMMGDFSKASREFQIAHEKAKQLQDVRFMVESLWGFSRVHFEQKEFEQSLQHLLEAEKMIDSTSYREDLIRIYRAFSDVYNATQDFEKASAYQRKYIQLKDSVYSEALIKNLARVQTDYEERENIKTIAEKNENIRLKEEVIARQKQVYYFIAALAILSIAMAFTFFMYNRAISRAKAQLTMLNETLELRVAERTKALQSVNNELDNFIYKTSHDIRGPLASLKGIANVALLELEDPKAKDYLRKLDNSADKLNSILTRLLIVNQINHAVLAPQKIDFEELINEILVFERKKGVPQNMNITHEIAPGVELITDRHLLRIVLENLIDNAIKYYSSSSRVEPFVKIKVGSTTGEVWVKVIDNGIGIQERDPQKLFQMFVRASERSESGGIGLYLTKLASERLEAKVDFATTAEKFTQFSVHLPPDLAKVLEAKDVPLKKA